MDHPSRQKQVWLESLGSLQWLRAHVSVFAIGSVLLLSFNLLWGGERVWALTAIGIWALLMLVHVIMVVIARLLGQLMEDEEEEEVVLLPIKDAVITSSPPSPTSASESADGITDPTVTWAGAERPAEQADPVTPATPDEAVSWEIATNAARLRRTESPENQA